MLTVSLIGKGDRIVCPYTQFNTGKISIGIISQSTLNRQEYETGLRPVNGKHNTYGQSDVSHVNVKGKVAWFGYGSGLQPYGSSYTYYSDKSGTVATRMVDGIALKANPSAFLTEFIYNDSGSTIRVFTRGEYQRDIEGGKVYFSKTERFLEMTCVRPNLFRVVSYSMYEAAYAPYTKTETYQAIWYEFRSDFTSMRMTTNIISSKFYGMVLSENLGIWGVWNAHSNRTFVSDVEPNDCKDLFTTRVLYERWELIQNRMVSPSHSDWGEMSMAAAKNARYLDINSTKYAADLLALKSMLDAFMVLPTQLKGANLKKIRKLVASGYLSIRYGLNLTVRDTQNLKDALDRFSSNMRFHKSYWDGSLTCQVGGKPADVQDEISSTRSKESRNTYVDANAFGFYVPVVSERIFTLFFSPHVLKEFRVMYQAFVWDVFPKMTTAWDYIPFSFVVNWFIPVFEQMFEQMDYRTQTNLVQLRGSCLTSRAEIGPIPARRFFGKPGMGYILGSVSVVKYDRTYRPDVPQPPSIDFYSTPEGWTFQRFIDGMSLFFQRIK